MYNPKFQFNKQRYEECVSIIQRVHGKHHITISEVRELHRLSTLLGVPSSPSSCGSCNNRALTILKNYVNKHKETYTNE